MIKRFARSIPDAIADTRHTFRIRHSIPIKKAHVKAPHPSLPLIIICALRCPYSTPHSHPSIRPVSRSRLEARRRCGGSSFVTQDKGQAPRPRLLEQVRDVVGHQQGAHHSQRGPRQHVRPVVLVVRDATEARVPGHHDEQVLQEVSQQFGAPPRHAGLEVDLGRGNGHRLANHSTLRGWTEESPTAR